MRGAVLVAAVCVLAGKDVSKADALRIDRTILAQERAWLARFERKLREGVDAFEDHVEALEREDQATMEDALDRSRKAFDASKELELSGCASKSQ